jgi:hypothetical protein
MPPGFTSHALREAGDAFQYAIANAADLGAASVVWVRRFDLVEFAVVLEPTEVLAQARLCHYMAMNAVADMLAAWCPPERPIQFGWPGAVLFDHGLIGGGRTAWPRGVAVDDAPDWIVFGAMLRAAVLADQEGAPRSLAIGSGVSMEETGFTDVSAVEMIESFARHLNLNAYEWSRTGPKAAAKRFLDRLRPVEGARQGIEPNGDLIVRSGDSEERRDFVAALEAADWYDHERGEPKL